jgi:hypothetical protein
MILANLSIGTKVTNVHCTCRLWSGKNEERRWGLRLLVGRDGLALQGSSDLRQVRLGYRLSDRASAPF